MLVKIMSDDGLPDGDAHKKFRLVVDVLDINFWHSDKPIPVDSVSKATWSPGPFVSMRTSRGNIETVGLAGNVYLLDDNGKTFDRFVIDPPRPPAPPV